jgi:hypothetical protein
MRAIKSVVGVAAIVLLQAAAGAAQSYTPPEDGKLTVQQIQMYVEVRREVAGSGAGTTATATNLSALLTGAAASELAAAEKLGIDPEEYRWVRLKVQEARTPAAVDRGPVLDRIDRQLRSRNAELQKRLGGRDSSEKAEAARAFNRTLVETFAQEFEELEQPRTQR